MASSRQLPASYNNKTYGTAGAGRDYTSLATWEADTDIDLVTATKGEVLTCYADSTTYSDANVELAGATTNSSYYRVVRAVSGSRGTLTSGVRFEVLNASGDTFIFNLVESYAVVQDIAAKVTAAVNKVAISFASATGTATKFIGCTAYNCSTSGTGSASGFNLVATAANATSFTINCVATGCTDAGKATVPGGGFRIIAVGKVLAVYLYNCTVVSNSIGIKAWRSSTESITINSKNCVIQGNTSNIVIASGITHNQTTNVTTGVTLAADGYHLASNDTGAINAGTDLSADGSFAFDDDIDGETRDDWDVGCDEYVAAATAKPYYYFRNQ
jgi:hypothetical protein